MGFSSSTLAFFVKILYDQFMTIFILLIIIFNFAFLAFNLRSAVAQTMSDDNYILQLQELDAARPKPTIKNSTLGVSDQKAPEQKPEPNYTVAPFTFSISETIINFGTLSPTNPIKRANKLTVSNGSASGYSVIAFEDRELSAAVASLSNATGTFDVPSDATFIPDTTCDNGQCSEIHSALWSNPLTYGFGYRCDNVLGSDCASGFSEVEFYKQFANASLSETPQKVAMGSKAEKEKTVRITYKINISGTQAKDSYQNVVTYIAVPNF